MYLSKSCQNYCKVRAHLSSQYSITNGSSCCYFSHSAIVSSGHNRWSKIRHDKAKVDASTNKERSAIAQTLQHASKLGGPDPKLNPALANLLASAKKSGFPKQLIEAAIARGQGVSPTGGALENITIEALLPSGSSTVAAIIECQTDSARRTLFEVRTLVKKHGGTVGPTSHLFEKKGRVSFEIPGGKDGLGEEDIFDKAVEAGAEDVKFTEAETQEGEGKWLRKFEVICEPRETNGVADGIETSCKIKRQDEEIVWLPKEETKVEGQAGDGLDTFIGKILCVDDTAELTIIGREIV